MVTKAGIGPESEFGLLCRSCFRWSMLFLRRKAYMLCLYYSVGGCPVGFVMCWPTSVAKCYPAGPSQASFNSDKVFQGSKFDCMSRRGSLT